VPQWQRVRLACLGVGYMGRTALGALESLRDLLGPRCEIELHVAEPKKDVREETLKRFPDARIQPDSQGTLDDLVRLTADDRVPVIIYDATPPELRAGNFQILATARANQYPITVLLEKPIAITQNQLTRIKQYSLSDDFFCDFIEIGNDAFRALHDHLKQAELAIDWIACWRANSSGIRRSFGDGRDGVKGGALLDKAAHDVALVACLLESESVSLKTAEVHHVVPRSPSSWYTVDGVVESDNEPEVWAKDDLLRPADGTASVTSLWKSKKREVPVSFVWGWHGTTGIPPETDIAQMLADLKHSRRYILNHTVDLVKEQEKYQTITNSGLFPSEPKIFSDDDVRLLIIGSGKHTIVCNLLGKEPVPGVSISRYVIDYHDGHESVLFETSPTSDLARINRRDLAHVFDLALRSQTDSTCATDICRQRSEFVHQFIFDAQKLAFREIEAKRKRFDVIHEESIRVLESKLRLDPTKID